MSKFIETIEKYLVNQSQFDDYLAARMKLENKSIAECCEYIISEVEKTGRAGFADEEIYAMARHYYTEDDLEINKKISANVVVNERSTENFKQSSKQKQEQPTKVKSYEQASLFDLSL